MASEARLNVILTLVDRMTNNLKGVNRTLAQNRDLLKRVSIAASAFSIASVLAIRSFSKAAIDSKQAQAALEAAIKGAGASFNEFEGPIDKAIGQLTKFSNYSKDEFKGALKDLIIWLGEVPLAIASLSVTADVAAATGTDLATAADQVGRFVKGETDSILGLAGAIGKDITNPLERLAWLQGKVAGQALANINPFKQFGNQINDTKAIIGKFIVDDLEPLLKKLGELLDMVGKLPPGVIEFGVQIGLIAAAISTLAGAVIAFNLGWPTFSTALLALAAFALSPVGLTLAGIATAILLIVDAQKKQKEIDDQQVELLRNLPRTAEEVAEAQKRLHERTLRSWDEMNKGMLASTNLNKPLILKSFSDIITGMTTLTDTEKALIIANLTKILTGMTEVNSKTKPVILKSFSDIVMGMTNLTDSEKTLIIKSFDAMLTDMLASTNKNKPLIINSIQDMWNILTGNFHTFRVDLTGKYDAFIKELIEMGNKARAVMGLPPSPSTPTQYTQEGAIISGRIVPPPPILGPPIPPGFGDVYGPPLPLPTAEEEEQRRLETEEFTISREQLDEVKARDLQRQLDEAAAWERQLQETLGLAEGGIVTSPTLAMIGERGPEAVIPLRKTGGLVINFNGPVYGMDNFEKAVAQAVRNASLRGGFYGVKVGI